MEPPRADTGNFHAMYEGYSGRIAVTSIVVATGCKECRCGGNVWLAAMPTAIYTVTAD